MDIHSLLQTGTLPTDVAVGPAQFAALWQLHPEQRGQIKILGELIQTPRWHKSYLHSYHFTGMIHEAAPLPVELTPMLEWACSTFQQPFNQVLVNWYQDGSDYIGPHSDDERQLLKGSPILSVSLGATRTFRIHPKKGGKKVLDVEVTNNSYIMMLSPMQQLYKHSIVKINGEKAKKVGQRINITFRVFQ